ncbi:MAG UNVERIFIED_CONTAM: hypothetical protein LVR18_17205 [Planctomycetaceae bacterium]
MGSLSSDYCEFSGSIGYHESSGHTHAAIPSVAGIVPATGSLSVATIANLRVLSVITKAPVTPMLPSPVLRGLSPRLGR